MAGRLIIFSYLLAIVALFSFADAGKPVIFIFGDSTVDVGTNNNLNASLARADHRYYGIDYAYSMPTGRFSNGRNTADFIAKYLGDYKKSPPPFLSLLKHNRSLKRALLRGVNFASGGSGLLYETGNKTWVEVIPLGQQIQQFATVVGNIREQLGAPACDSMISSSLYIISVGSNDIFDYLRYNDSNLSVQSLIINLHDAYANHLENLYNMGARKFGIISVPPIGCCPAARIYNLTHGCIEEANEIARAFYTSIDDLMHKFANKFQGVKYSLGNAYQMTMTIIDNPPYFLNITSACCGGGPLNGRDSCEEGANLCSNRKEYLFWDMFHPTEAACEMAAQSLVYGEGPQFVTPINFSQLAMDG